MSGFVKAHPAPVPRTKESGYVATLYAGIVAVMAVAQLFTFEDFILLFQQLFLPLGEGAGVPLAVGIVVAEVFALPFLLRLPLSVAFRWLSFGLAGVVSIAWLVISIWSVVTKPDVSSTGLLGTLDPLGPGLWAVSLLIALVALAIWSLWGLFPIRRTN